MAKARKKPYWVEETEETLEIHITGEILHDQVFQQIVEVMKANRERERPKAVRFFVTNSMMMMSVRYAIPSQFYGSIQLEPAEKGVLKDAAGLGVCKHPLAETGDGGGDGLSHRPLPSPSRRKIHR